MRCDICEASVEPFTAWWYKDQCLCDPCKQKAEKNGQ